MDFSTYTTLSHATIVSNVPRRVEALVGAVLAHGADPDAIGQLDPADLERREELRDLLARGLRDDGVARDGILLGGEEGGIGGGLVGDGAAALGGLF